MDLINTASDYLNFTYSIKNPIYWGWMEKDGSYSGLNGAVINKVVDFNIGLYMQHLVFPVTHYVLVHGLFLVLKRLHGLKP